MIAVSPGKFGIAAISPPLDIREKWFAPHVAYTMAKFGMSLVVLGLAGELRSKGIAANALWPRTTIATAAIEVFFPQAVAASRKPAIVAEAAHAIVVADSRKTTGNFFIDEEVLRAQGVTDFSHYAVQRGTPLAPDLFLD